MSNNEWGWINRGADKLDELCMWAGVITLLIILSPAIIVLGPFVWLFGRLSE